MRIIAGFATIALSTTTLLAQGAAPKEPLVEFENMTWPEMKAALAAGKTTALFYTGGTEHRGPQNTNGGHNYMSRATVKAIALKLGNAIAMPVLPFTPNNASATYPGTIGLTDSILSIVLERIADQAITTGFRNVVLMGDHGGGQPGVYAAVAKKLDDKYGAQGIHVFYADSVYGPAQDDFNNWLVSQGYPRSGHAAIFDTSEMMYVCGDACVRKELLPTAVGDPVLARGEQRDPNRPRANNGITGDASRSSAELGKMLFDQRVKYAVSQIQRFVAGAK